MKYETAQGTITWFEVAKGELPPAPEDGQITRNLLLLNEDKDLVTRGFYQHEIPMWCHVNGNWQPTHWAFINLPEKTTA